MRVKTLDDFRAPSRRPWLWVVLVSLVVAGGVYGLRWRRERQPAHDTVATVDGAPAETETAAVAPPRPERSGLETPAPVAAAFAQATAPVDGTAIGAEAAAERLEAARRLAAAENLSGARVKLLTLLPVVPTDALRRETEKVLGDLHIALATTPRMMPEKTDYIIQRGDSLQRIANRFGTTIGLVQQSNQIENPNRISIGDRLRVLDRPTFAITVSKRRNTLLVTLNGRFFKRYDVGTGAYGKTPEGTFEVRDRITNPPWWPSGGREIPFGHPDNILGTRWMSLVATGDTPPLQGYGIHGTWDDSTIGTQSSAGCIRMRNADVEELFLFAVRGTPVTISE